MLKLLFKKSLVEPVISCYQKTYQVPRTPPPRNLLTAVRLPIMSSISQKTSSPHARPEVVAFYSLFLFLTAPHKPGQIECAHNHLPFFGVVPLLVLISPMPPPHSRLSPQPPTVIKPPKLLQNCPRGKIQSHCSPYHDPTVLPLLHFAATIPFRAPETTYPHISTVHGLIHTIHAPRTQRCVNKLERRLWFPAHSPWFVSVKCFFQLLTRDPEPRTAPYTVSMTMRV